jgi:hypothetical protein
MLCNLTISNQTEKGKSCDLRMPILNAPAEPGIPAKRADRRPLEVTPAACHKFLLKWEGHGAGKEEAEGG